MTMLPNLPAEVQPPAAAPQVEGSDVPEPGARSDPPSSPNAKSQAPRDIRRLALLLAAAFAACLLGYLVLNVPGAWFPDAKPVAFGPHELTIAKGSGRVVGNELMVTAADASETTVVSALTDFRSSDYPAIAWVAIDVPEDAAAFLLWQTDYAPERVNSVPVRIESGRPQPVIVSGHPQWIGRVKGVALVLRGALPQPVRVRGVVAKPMGALELLRDRFAEWTAFEGWTGTSINTITGGADVQDLPLPLLTSLAVALAAAALFALARRRVRLTAMPLSAACVALFLLGWLVLDARWTLNLSRQNGSTTELYAGKSIEQRRARAEDGALYAFVQKVRDALPADPHVRVFIVADAHYYRGRAAYHLYPHNVYFSPRSNAMPLASQFRAGDWLLVYQRKGVAYDPAQHRLRWDDSQTREADLRLVGPGAALFLVR